ncbi:MAG: nucleoside-triphosphatase [Candidatus Promineifilaceae bacterium]
MHHQSDSPVSLLVNLFLIEDPAPELVIVSGPSGSGKTRACLELVEILNGFGINASGLISSPVYKDNRKVAVDLIAIHNADRLRLAMLREDSPAPHEEDVDAFINYGRWRFDPDTFAWGNSILRHLPESQCLIIDELGPLEFKQGSGLQAGMSLLDRRQQPPAFVVVREELASSALLRWPWGMVVNIPLVSDELESPGEAS